MLCPLGYLSRLFLCVCVKQASSTFVCFEQHPIQNGHPVRIPLLHIHGTQLVVGQLIVHIHPERVRIQVGLHWDALWPDGSVDNSLLLVLLFELDEWSVSRTVTT